MPSSERQKRHREQLKTLILETAADILAEHGDDVEKPTGDCISGIPDPKGYRIRIRVFSSRWSSPDPWFNLLLRPFRGMPEPKATDSSQ